jgi:hypothetical protein
MKKEMERKKRRVVVLFSKVEYEALEKLRATTTCKALSEYVRRCVLQKPVSFKCRNQSIDDLLIELSLVRKELNAIGNNFNQAVWKLQALQFAADIKKWVLINEKDKTLFFTEMAKIKIKIEQIYQLWSQE